MEAVMWMLGLFLIALFIIFFLHFLFRALDAIKNTIIFNSIQKEARASLSELNRDNPEHSEAITALNKIIVLAAEGKKISWKELFTDW